MMKPKSVAKGAASYFVKRFRYSGTGVDGAFRAESSYAIFMRYLMALHSIGLSFQDKIVVEFGPGSSFGIGIAALLCGARRYYAYDLVDHTTDDRNLFIFDEVCQLLRDRNPVPIHGWCSRIFPFIDDPSFPRHILTEPALDQNLNSDRVNNIRQDLASRTGDYIRVRSSAGLSKAEMDEPADIIISESVLEHVDDLNSTYAAFNRWLSADGVMVHLIDYGCHNLASEWNGHWQCSPKLWSLVRGKRNYLINRVPHHGHLKLLELNGMRVIHCELLRRVDGITQDQFDAEFRSMDPRDATTALASIVCRRIGGTMENKPCGLT